MAYKRLLDAETARNLLTLSLGGKCLDGLPGGSVSRRPMLKRKQVGFSLIELLIVVAIILIVAAIALPNLIVARMSANEASAVQSLRTIQSAETAYAVTYTNVGFSATLADLAAAPHTASSASSAQACLIHSLFSSGNQS